MSKILSDDDLVAQGGTLLGKTETAKLWYFPERDSPPWKNYQIRLSGKRPKNVYRLGFNGERFANGRDLPLIQKHEPDVFNWFVRLLGGV